MDLEELVHDIAEGLVRADASAVAFRSFQRGIGPYGEPQLVKLVSAYLNEDPKYGGMVVTKRTPELLIPGQWATEFKIARPFGDNGKEAANWSVNLLHPYAGNVSTVGDCLKLAASKGSERKAVIVVGYEHNPPKSTLSHWSGHLRLSLQTLQV